MLRKFRKIVPGSQCSVLQNSNGIIVLKLHSSKLNLFNKSFVKDLKIAVGEIKTLKASAIIVKSDLENVFSAGADLKERHSLNITETRKFIHQLRSLFLSIHKLPVPTISCIEGTALGGGLELALMTDIRFAGIGSKFGLPETRLAVIPGAGGTQTLPQVVGYGHAAEMIYTGRILDSKEALQIGLINKLLPVNEVFEHSLQVAQKISISGSIAVKAAKSALMHACSEQGKLELKMKKEIACYERVLRTKDRREGLDAFIAKRSPQFSGR